MLNILCTQKFEPESFVDSLLGIGLGSSKGEGKALASRLTEMRSERNARAKTAAAAKKAPAIKIGGSGANNPAGQLTFNPMGDGDSDDDGMRLITAGGGISRGSSSTNKSKKKKKKTKR